MSIQFQVLGQVHRDNALLVKVDSGQAVSSLLFDCGDGCLSELSFGDIQNIDYLFFSHLHMDHIGGFDSFFRCTFDRQSKPNIIFGPANTSNILQHRFQGFLWNLHTEMTGTWTVNDVSQDNVKQTRFELSEAFTHRHSEGSSLFEKTILDTHDFKISAFIMNHNTDCLAYLVEEKAKVNLDTSKLNSLGLKPGPWIQDIKNPSKDDGIINIDGTDYDLLELRAKLLVETKGESIAYLTDFLLNDEVISELSQHLSYCDTIICEAQYRHEDEALAKKNYHMTVKYAAQLALAANANELVLFHISDRYRGDDLSDMLSEAQSIFPNTRFPDAWFPDT